MKKLFWTPFILLLSASLALLPGVASAQDPVAMLDSVANQMIDNLKSRQMSLKSNPTQVYSLATKLVVPHADLDYMSKRVLPPQIWASASNAQRVDFKHEFTTLLVRTYASALANYSDQTVKFYPVRGGATGRSTVQVNSEIVRTDGPSIPIRYSLIAAGSQWKVYDMTVEGVSMLESFRSQFADKLSQGNISDLISALKQHNQQNSGA